MMAPNNELKTDRHKGRGGKSRESENVDIEVLRKEYRNMQANRNAFAHESDLVSNLTMMGAIIYFSNKC